MILEAVLDGLGFSSLKVYLPSLLYPILPHVFLNKMEMAYIDVKLRGDGSIDNAVAADRFSWREVRQGFAPPRDALCHVRLHG